MIFYSDNRVNLLGFVLRLKKIFWGVIYFDIVYLVIYIVYFLNKFVIFILIVCSEWGFEVRFWYFVIRCLLVYLLAFRYNFWFVYSLGGL